MRASLRLVCALTAALAAVSFAVPASASNLFEKAGDALGGIFDKSHDRIPYCEPGQKCGINEGAGIVADGVNDLVTDRTASQYAQDVASNIVGVLGVVGVLFIMYAGFLYLTANGEEEKTKTAKSIIVSVLVGYVIIFLAWALVAFVTHRVLAPAPAADAAAPFGG